jgi:outer membrane protein assembly factor BamB
MLSSVVWLLSLFAASQDWPQHLGPSRDGVYTGGLVSEAAPELVWKIDVGQGFSAPVVKGGRLILFHRVDNRERVDAVDAGTGELLWSYDYATAYRDDFGFDEGPRATPTVAGGRVFTFGAQGVLHALDFETGEKIWSVDTRARFGVRKGWFGAASSSLVVEDKLLHNVGSRDGAGIVAFDTATGKVLWQATDDEVSYSSPTRAGSNGVFFTRSGLVLLELDSGVVRYEKRWRSRSNASVNGATPLVIDDIIFISASYGTGATVLRMSDEGLEELWSSDDALSNHYATAVHRDGVLYGFHGRQEYGQAFRAIDLKSGKVHWSVDRFMAGTVTLSGDRLVIVRESGELVIAEASPEAFRVLGRAELLPGVIRAYPALANGHLYVRNERTLACFKLDRRQ